MPTNENLIISKVQERHYVALDSVTIGYAKKSRTSSKWSSYTVDANGHSTRISTDRLKDVVIAKLVESATR
jgi:hypothetical protein